MKLRIRETYLIFLIVIGLVSLSLYTTYAMFTATTTIEDVVDFDTSLTLTTSLSEYELITLTGNETQVIEVNVTNSYDSTLCYGIWYEVVSGDSSSLDIGTFTEKNTTLPSGTITSGNTVTAVVGMSNGSTSSITLKLGTIGRETSGSSCSLGITSPRSLIGTEWADVILVTDEYLSEHTTTTSNDYSWSSSTSGSTTLTLNSGTYKLEVWGAQGGSYSSTYATGGKGGYSYGTLTLNQETTVYAYVGGQGSYYATTTYTSKGSGGSNGGGNAAYRGGTGGGASDIRIGTDSLYARVIVAGGGGGAYAYNSAYKANGGVGGGTTGGDGSYYSTYTTYRGYGGTQTAGGAAGTASSGNYNGTDGSFGVGGDTGYKYNSSSYYSNGAGGGGWYGGGAADNYSGSSRNYASGGGGGSGYVYTSSTASSYPSGCLLNSSHYLTDAATVAGSTSFTDYDGTTVTGHSGNGAIKITGITSTIYSIPTLSGLTTLRVKLGASADYTTGVEVVCASGTTGCSIVTYPTLDTSTLEEGTYTVYYVAKGSDNKKYKYAREVEVYEVTDISINKVMINNTVVTTGIPKTGLYNMSSNCSNLSYNSFTKELKIKGGSVPLDCEINFTENTNYPLLNTMKVGDYVAYVGNNGCNNGVDGTTGTSEAEAGNSCKGENANQSEDASGYTYGYCGYSDNKYYVYGWRIAYIEDNKVYLISAGSPECIKSDYSSSPVQEVTYSNVTMGTSTIYYATNYTYNSSTGEFSLDQNSTITSGKYSSVYYSVNNYYTCKSTSQTGTCTKLYHIQSYDTGNYAYVNVYSNMSLGNAENISKFNTAALDYCNVTYADGGTCSSSNTWAMGNTDFQKITNAISGTSSSLTSAYDSSIYCYDKGFLKRCGYNNDLIDNGGYYWFAAYYTASSTIGIYWVPNRRNIYGDSGPYVLGFRPIISLSSNVYVTGGSGTMEDPYTIGI